MAYKTTDALMRHLRQQGIQISGSTQKRQLINTGYYHGYKGYRFYKDAQHRLPFISYDEIYATIQYDAKLKALFYDKIMFLETAIKNISLTCILKSANSENIQDMYDKVITSYKNAPAGSSAEIRQQFQNNKLSLQSRIHSYIAKAYKNNDPKIAHFYSNSKYSSVPLWALFEIIMMGDFGFLLSCLNYSTRDMISKEIGLNLAVDANRELIYKYLYILKELRNAIAHNDVIFDTRFRHMKPSKAMQRCLELSINLNYVNFKSIGDYIILVCYYLKLLKIPKQDTLSFIHTFLQLTNEYKKSVNSQVAHMVINPDWTSRMTRLEKFL